MANEISGIGYLPARGLGQAGGSPSGTGRVVAEPRPPQLREAQDTFRQAGFSALAGAKDEVAHTAQSIRQADRGYQQMDTLLQGMRQQAETLLKIYPPYPPGSEQRVAYLNTINGLRQQLEAVTFPSPEKGEHFIFYPRELDLPTLNPKTADDGQLADFVAALDAAHASIYERSAELRALVDNLFSGGHAGLPRPPQDDSSAQAIGRSTADQIRQASSSLLGENHALEQLGT